MYIFPESWCFYLQFELFRSVFFFFSSCFIDVRNEVVPYGTAGVSRMQKSKVDFLMFSLLFSVFQLENAWSNWFYQFAESRIWWWWFWAFVLPNVTTINALLLHLPSGMHPISFASRFSRVDRKRINVERPSVVENYNKFMGGTDRMNQNIGYYRIGMRKRKWWWSIFTWLIDVSIQNAWLLQRKAGMKSMTQFQFRRNIAQHYCHAVAYLLSTLPHIKEHVCPKKIDMID